MFDNPASDRAPRTPSEWFLCILFMLFFFSMIVGMIVYDFQPIKLGIVFVLGSWVLLLLTHEAGHAVAARWLGCRVTCIVLGMGMKLGVVHVGGIPVEIRLAPIEGFVRYEAADLRWPRLGMTFIAADLRWPRLGMTFIYFAGPATDLLLGTSVLLLGDIDQFGQSSNDYGHILWQSFVVAALAQGVLNLIPHGVSTPQGEIPNDGLGIFRSLWGTLRYEAKGEPTNPPDDAPGISSDDEYDQADWWKRR